MRYLHVLLLAVGLLLLIPQGQVFASTQKQQTYMGFTPWPYDLTEEAVDGTYDFILKNGNIVAHHFPQRRVLLAAVENFERFELQTLGIGVHRVDDAATAGT